MKTLVVGNSLAVIANIERIVQEHQGAQITLFATESVLPYDRALLPSLVAGRIRETQVYSLPENFCQEHRVEIIAGEKLARISVKRRYLTTANKTQINYDHLVLVDTGELILPLVKGYQKEGVFDCWRLTSTKAMMQYLPFADNVTVVVTNMQGLNMACALSQLKKEVTVVARGRGLVPEVFDEETGALLKQILEGKGISVFDDNAVEEILGDAQVKAIKLKSAKVLACAMVIFDEARADIRMLSEPTLSDTDEICIEECFKPLAIPLAPVNFGLNVLDGFCAGWTKLPQGGREYLKFDGPQNIYKKIYAHGDCLVGAVLFNAPSVGQRLWDLIQHKQNITGKEEELLSA